MSWLIFFIFYSFENINNSPLLKSNYVNALELCLKATDFDPNARLNCDEIPDNKHLWALNETEQLEWEKFDAKKQLKKSLEKRTNEETYVYSILRSKLNVI